MANETKITDIVDKSSLDALDAMNFKINEIVKTYQKAVKEIGTGLSIKVNGLEDYSKKLQALTAAIDKSVSADNALKEAKKEQEALLKKVAEQMSVNVKEALEKAKADKIAEQASLAAAKAETERLKQEKLINQTRRQAKISVEEAIALTKKEAKTLQEATDQNRLLRAAKMNVDITTEAGRKIVMQMNAAIDKNTETIRRNADAMVKQKMTIGDYQEQVKAAIISIQNGDRSMKNFGVVAKGYGGILKTHVASGFDEVRMGVGSMIKGMVGAQAVIGGFQKLLSLFSSGVGSIISFEAANSKLAAVLGTTSKNIKDLISDAERLGITTKYTASEATNLQIELAKLGFSKKEILESTESILKFAQATGADLPEAAALAGASLRMFDASTKQSERYVSAMAVATAKSALSFSYLQTAMPIVGPVAKAFNFQIEDTLALLGKLADSGFDASMASTATRNILLNLADGSGKLAQSLGAPVKNLPDLVAGLKKLKEQGIDLNSTLELTDKRSVAAFNAFLTSADKIVPLREQITGVSDDLSSMADTMADNVEGAIAGLSSAWEGFMLSFSSSTGPMKDVLDFLAKGIREAAKNLRSYSQLQDDADNKAVSMAQKEMSNSDILEKHRSNMARLYKEKLNDGMNSEEAALEAKKEYIASLKSLSEKENTAYQLEITKREKLESELSNRGMVETLFSWRRTKNVIKEEISTAITAAAGKKAVSSITESLVEDLDKVDFKEGGTSGSFKPVLTDKEKTAQEKAAKEVLKIRETYQQSELELMDEGLEKELAKVSLNYTKKMAAVKGQSKEEIATRQNIAEEMKRAIEEKTETYNANREKADITNRLEVVKKGSGEELRLKLRALELEREAAINESEKTGESVFFIDEKYQAKRVSLIEKFANERLKKMQDEHAGRSVIINQAMQDELSLLAKQYANGEITKEEAERKKSDITTKYGIKQAELAVELAKKQLDVANLSVEDEEALRRKLAEAEIALSNAVAEAEVANAEKTADAHKKKMEKVAESIQMVGDLLNSFADLGSALFDRKIQEVEEEQDANDEAGERDIERIKNLEDSGAISKEEAEVRKRAAEQQTAAKEAELAKKKAELQTKQAKMEKANSIVQAIMSTSLAIMKQLAATPLPLGAPMVALIAAMGAIQLATIIAQPIPKYAKGTDNHPGGPAIVGDGGKHEAVVVGSKYFVTPNTSTLLDLPSGAKVIPDIDKEMADLHKMAVISDAMMLYNAKREDGSRVTINNDYSDLKNEMKTTNRILSGMDKHRKRTSSRQSFNSYVNSKL